MKTITYAVSALMVGNYERALQLDRYFPDTYHNIADTLFKLGRRDALVREHNRRSLELRPSMREARELERNLR